MQLVVNLVFDTFVNGAFGEVLVDTAYTLARRESKREQREKENAVHRIYFFCFVYGLCGLDGFNGLNAQWSMVNGQWSSGPSVSLVVHVSLEGRNSEVAGARETRRTNVQWSILNGQLVNGQCSMVNVLILIRHTGVVLLYLTYSLCVLACALVAGLGGAVEGT